MFTATAATSAITITNTMISVSAAAATTDQQISVVGIISSKMGVMLPSSFTYVERQTQNFFYSLGLWIANRPYSCLITM